MVFPSVHYILKNREEAEDVMQESLIKGFEKLKELKEPEKYPGWQKQISVRCALGKLRQKKHMSALFIDVKDESEEQPINELLNMDVQLVHQKLEMLPEGYRLTVRLHLLEGLSHDEIGESLGIASSTSRSQYCRAIARLKRELLEEYEKQI
jgi:RNA polymerase sigma factor (sigma-70 family)